MNYEDKIIELFKLFKNKPYLLAKFLIKNEAFSDSFINKIIHNMEISDVGDEKVFKSIKELEKFYDSLISEDIENDNELEKSLNNKLNEFINEENYEQAAYIRDIMKEKNIKRKK